MSGARASAALLDGLEADGGEVLRGLGFRGRLRLLAEAGSRFLDPDDPLAREALHRLPADSGLPAAECSRVLAGMARDWTSERLAAAIRADFPDPGVLDGFVAGVRGARERVVPPRLLVQVCAGNVPGTGATALLRGLLVGAPTLLKSAEGDRVLPELLGRAIREADPRLGAAFALAEWKGGAGTGIEREALARAERVVVYGGKEAVAGVRVLAGPLTPVVAYGPRVSFGVVLRSATGAEAPVEDCARAASAYAQRGCVSPQLVFVEEGGERSAESWAEALAEVLARLGNEPDPGAAPGMRALREEADFAAAAGRGDRAWGGPEAGWMVVFEPGVRPFEPSPLGRTVRVRPIGSVEELPGILAPARQVLQCAGVEGREPARSGAALLLARAGVTRITPFRDQPWPPAWWRHDGEGPLRVLVRWVSLEGPPEGTLGP